MTEHPTPTPSSATSRTNELDAVVQACVHIDAAAHQLETAAGPDAFSSLFGLASQLNLVRGGIDPTIRAAYDPHDRLGPIGHVDSALALLEGAHSPTAPADLLAWTSRLSAFRESFPNALLAAWAARP